MRNLLGNSSATAAVFLFVVGCSPPPAVVQLQAVPDEVSLLAGLWEGEYSSQRSGRQGQVRFLVDAGETNGRPTARGDILMIPTDATLQVPWAHGPGEDLKHGHAPTSQHAQLLSIFFVRLNPGSPIITGAVAPYRDPECGCILSTEFVGVLAGDRIQGIYVAHAAAGSAVQSGEWWVKRVSLKLPL